MRNLIKRIGLILPALLLFVLLSGCVPQASKTGIVPDAGIKQSATATEQETEATPEPAEESLPDEEIIQSPAAASLPDENLPVEGESYYDLQNVVLYLDLYGKLPDNYITKDEARKLGWEGGSVEDYLKDAAIGGDHFGNYEGILPQMGKNAYQECDIDTHGYKNRGSRRLIYTKDGNYYYSDNHYKSFRQVILAEDHSISFGETLD